MGTIFWDIQNENGNYILGRREYNTTYFSIHLSRKLVFLWENKRVCGSIKRDPDYLSKWIRSKP